MDKKFCIRQFNGSLKWQWAVFVSADLKDLPGRVIFTGQAEPLFRGLTVDVAGSISNDFNRGDFTNPHARPTMALWPHIAARVNS